MLLWRRQKNSVASCSDKRAGKMGDRKTIAKAARSVRILLVIPNFQQLPNSKGPESKWVLMKTQEDAGPCGWMQGSVSCPTGIHAKYVVDSRLS